MKFEPYFPYTENVPSPVQKLIYFEQDLLFRGRDPSKLSMDIFDIENKFLPESKKIFNLQPFYVDAKRFKIFGSMDFNKNNLYELNRSKILHFLHPAIIESGDIVKNEFNVPDITYFGTPTSSTRTLLVWSEDNKQSPFYLKLNMPFNIGGVSRSLDSVIISRSIGTSQILDGIKLENFNFLREVHGVVLKNKNQEGGMIIREIPDRFLGGDNYLVPFFSLFKFREPENLPLLFLTSRCQNNDFIEDIIFNYLEAFARQWLKLIVFEGCIPEPHAQNLLLEFDKSFNFTGNYFHRDLESFYIDIDFRRRKNKFLPDSLPIAAKNEAINYKQTKFKLKTFNSLYIYFQGSVLYCIQLVLDKLVRAKILGRKGYCHNIIESRFKFILARIIREDYCMKADSNIVNDYNLMINLLWKLREEGT